MFLPKPSFEILLPNLPPLGINSAYGVTQPAKGKSRIYKKKEVTEWEDKAALIVRNKASLTEWKLAKGVLLSIEIVWWGRKNDVDSFSKGLMDLLGNCLGFDDSIVWSLFAYKLDKGVQGEEGCYLAVYKHRKNKATKTFIKATSLEKRIRRFYAFED